MAHKTNKINKKVKRWKTNIINNAYILWDIVTFVIDHHTELDFNGANLPEVVAHGQIVLTSSQSKSH